MIDDERFTVRLSSGHRSILLSIARRTGKSLSKLCAEILKQHIWNLPRNLPNFKRRTDWEYE